MAKVEAPPPRDMYQEGSDSLRAQVDLAPEVYAARKEYDPKYVDLDLQTLNQSLFGSESAPGLIDTYRKAEPALSEFTARATSASRERDVADLEKLGARAASAVRAADPRSAALEEALTDQAMGELASGASLDPSLANQVRQSARASQADRGFGFGLADAVTEAYALGDRGEALRRNRQAFAQGVLAQRRAGAVDPALVTLGRASSTPAATAGVVGQAGGIGAGAPTFDPFNPYAADLFNTNYNADAAARIASGNAKAALWAAGINAVGNIAGGWLGGR